MLSFMQDLHTRPPAGDNATPHRVSPELYSCGEGRVGANAQSTGVHSIRTYPTVTAAVDALAQWGSEQGLLPLLMYKC